MAELNPSPAEEYDYDTEVVTIDEAEAYAEQVAEEAINAYAAYIQPQQKEQPMNETTYGETAQAVIDETKLSAQLVSGEILLDNIETAADKLILSRLNWFQRLTISKRNKELAVTLATYAIVHAIKTGGFGLTKYRINHVALDYVTLAANQRMVKFLVSTVGIVFLKVPEVTTAAGE